MMIMKWKSKWYFILKNVRIHRVRISIIEIISFLKNGWILDRQNSIYFCSVVLDHITYYCSNQIKSISCISLPSYCIRNDETSIFNDFIIDLYNLYQIQVKDPFKSLSDWHSYWERFWRLLFVFCDFRDL